ncbi:MAG: DUF2147 domain-containing protein [Proteobacteria bacterium]|nr:DUF2147 domain-containing protein [Pseudomonadota bacterium]
MRKLLATLTFLPLLGAPALAANPDGDWLVADKTAQVRVERCADHYLGVIAWEKEPALDSHNPDPTKRNRPLLGSPVLVNMKPAKPNLWKGEVYNADDGRTYAATMALLGPNTMRVEGCVAGGLICGGEEWTRVVQPTAPPPAISACPRPQRDLSAKPQPR